MNSTPAFTAHVLPAVCIRSHGESFAPAFGICVAMCAGLAGCGFPRPADVSGEFPEDGNTGGVVIRVAPTGDDANDGVSQPVKTLRRGLALAAVTRGVTTISLAAGRYATAFGETFPYAIPAGVTLAGAPVGGSVVVGAKTEVGILLSGSALQDLELEDFATAITATGAARLTNVKIRTSNLALQAETEARLSVDNVEVQGAAGACASGVVLKGAAELDARALVTRGLGTAVSAQDLSVVKLAAANLTGDRACPPTNRPVIAVETSKALSIVDSMIATGNVGLAVTPRGDGLVVSVKNTVIREMVRDGIAASAAPGRSYSLSVVGGQLSDNGSGAELFGASTLMDGVSITRNQTIGLYSQDGGLTMRNCLVVDNATGVDVLSSVSVDLGTVAAPGKNTLRNNSSRNLLYESAATPGGQLDAVGNLWNPSVQGADAEGKYPAPAVVPGTVTVGQNYGILCDPGQCSLRR